MLPDKGKAIKRFENISAYLPTPERNKDLIFVG